MEIGTIIEMSKNSDGDIECRVDFGSGDECTAVLGQSHGRIDYPMIDDEVAVDRMGAENVIAAAFTAVDGVNTGESIMYSRDSSGSVSASVKCSSDGIVKNGDGTDFVAMSAKADALWAKLDSVFRSWVPVVNDGGAALKTAYTGSFASPPSSVASTNLKAD